MRTVKISNIIALYSLTYATGLAEAIGSEDDDDDANGDANRSIIVIDDTESESEDPMPIPPGPIVSPTKKRKVRASDEMTPSPKKKITAAETRMVSSSEKCTATFIAAALNRLELVIYFVLYISLT
jgi:hypothetical protein